VEFTFVSNEQLARIGINVVAMLLLVFGMYYPRYRDKELVTTASMFNIFVFGILTVLSSVEFSLTAGFGLFAILALFTLRSEQISKLEITYFFGSISIAVICSIEGTTLDTVASVVGIVLIGAYVLDHPRILRASDGVKITLDQIDPDALSNPDRMKAELSKRLGVQVMSYQITTLDYVTDLARINVFFRKS
jgi:predicted membrane protein